MNLEDIQKSIKEKLKQEEENKKLWLEVKEKYPQLAEDIDFHIFKQKCFGGDTGCRWEDFKK